MSGCYVSCLSNPDPSFLWYGMSGCYAHPFLYPDLPSFLNLVGVIGIPLFASYIVWRLLFYLKSPMSSNKILLSTIINLINSSSTNYHNLTTFFLPSVVIGTSANYHVSCMTLTPIRVHLHSHLLLHA